MYDVLSWLDAIPLDAPPLDASPLDAPPLDEQPLVEQHLGGQPLNEQPHNKQPFDQQLLVEMANRSGSPSKRPRSMTIAKGAALSPLAFPFMLRPPTSAQPRLQRRVGREVPSRTSLIWPFFRSPSRIGRRACRCNFLLPSKAWPARLGPRQILVAVFFLPASGYVHSVMIGVHEVLTGSRAG